MDSPEEAGALIINTCGFIQAAKEESLEVILDAARAWPDRPLVVMGCLVERYRRELAQGIPEVSAWFGVDEREALVTYLGETCGTAAPDGVVTPFRPGLTGSWAYLKVSDGCSHRCSFCAIPLIKGPYHGESLEAILAQADEVLTAGARELVLVGQDTALWRDRGVSLTDLLSRLGEDPRVARLRLMYLHPEHVDDRLLLSVAKLPCVCRYLDMPFQHAAPAVLQRMCRRGNRYEYLELIARAREVMPEVSVRSTFIVGFPGETEEDFQELMAFVEEAGFDHAGAFAFSAEEGTPAAGMRPRVPVRVARRRLAALTGLLADVAEGRKRTQIGRRVEVLVDGPASADAPEGAVAVGRTDGQAPEVDGVTYLQGGSGGGLQAGALVNATITDVLGYDLLAEMG